MTDLGWWKHHRLLEDSKTWRRLNPFGRDVMMAILNNVDYKTGEWTTNLPDIKSHVHEDTGIQSIRTALKIMVDTEFINDVLTGSRQRKITVINWLFYQQPNGANTPQQAEVDLLTAKLTGKLTGKITEKDIVDAVLFYKNDLSLTAYLTGSLTGKYLEANRLIIYGLKAFKEVKKKKKDICVEKKDSSSNAISLNLETWEWINLTEEKIIEYENKYYHADVRFVLSNMVEKAKVGELKAEKWGSKIITFLSNEHKWNKERAEKRGESPRDYRIKLINSSPPPSDEPKVDMFADHLEEYLKDERELFGPLMEEKRKQGWKL